MELDKVVKKIVLCQMSPAAHDRAFIGCKRFPSFDSISFLLPSFLPYLSVCTSACRQTCLRLHTPQSLMPPLLTFLLPLGLHLSYFLLAQLTTPSTDQMTRRRSYDQLALPASFQALYRHYTALKNTKAE